MAIFKCKICGGALEIDSAQSVATCEYCGTKQTLPRLDDERRANLYDRANHFRRNNDFDKAMGIFEQILNEEPTDAEAYWSIVLCRYGIEYVEDPTTRRRVPTVNRAQFTSIFDDEDYKSAIANADGYQREIYEAEANAINELQKNILAISQKEEPFDVFICYKESDASGRRTKDSVLATELYHELVREGFKVFFARITLEDKLGQEYEPYIFAALNSAKVMVVLGTRPEHFNAVWVKNEWSRYLALIKNGARKALIPAYRDMDPYDLPEEFSHLQAQDMSKLGFMQDLVHGIKKIVEADAPKTPKEETIVTATAAPNIAPLLKRAFMFLEDGEFDRADEFCEQVLNQDPENAEAYLGKLMAELRVTRRTDLADCAEPFDDNKTYQKALRFADASFAADLKSYISTIKDRNARKAELAHKEALYNQAMKNYHSYDIVQMQNALRMFSSLPGYKDSDERVRFCQSKIQQIRAEQARWAEEKRIADEKARLEMQRQTEIKCIEAQKRAKRNKKIAIIVTSIVLAVLVFILVLVTVIVPNSKYNHALLLMNDGKYEESILVFEELGDYKESKSLVKEAKYNIFSSLIKEQRYTEAIVVFKELGDYKDMKFLLYESAIDLMDADRHFEAIALFNEIKTYQESSKKIAESLKKIVVHQTIAAGNNYSIGLKSNGTITFVGKSYYNDIEEDLKNWDNIVSIVASTDHVVGLKGNGTVVASGDNNYNQCNITTWSDIISIAVSCNHTVGLKSDGTVVAVGWNAHGQCNVENWTGIVAIAASYYNTIGLKSDGTVVFAGLGSAAAGWTDIVAISAGNDHIVGLKKDGTVIAAGDNVWNQCNTTTWTDIVAISAFSYHTVGLKKDGTVLTTGSHYGKQCDTAAWRDIVSISAGFDHTIGLKKDGTVVAVGDNDSGQCDTNNWTDIKQSSKN